MLSLKDAAQIAALENRIAKLEAVLNLTSGSFVLAQGDSRIVIKRTSIEIHSKDVSIVASGKVDIKASGDLVMKGSRILQN